MRKVILTTGGTGGHIYPALAIAEELKNRGVETLFIGSSVRMEQELIPKEGFKFIGLEIYPLRSLSALWKMLKSIRKAYKLIKEENPDAVIGFGNYISVPALVAAALLKKKIYLQEQNVKMGAANRVFYRFSDKTFVSFDETFEEIPIKHQDKIVATGNPIRKEFFRIDRELEREKLKMEKDEKMVLIIGGSLGAKSINSAIMKNIDDFVEEKKLRLYWATGKKNFQEINEKLGRVKNNDVIKPYFDNIPSIMAAADMVVCRAGASTISELIELEKPSILIPYGYVGQMDNAMVLAKAGAAMIVEDEKAEDAVEIMFELAKDNSKLQDMRRKAKSLKRGNAVNKIVEEMDIWRIN